MPPKAKRRKVVWNNNDCRAAVCTRPEGTSSWVQCDSCGGWYHVVCLFLDKKNDLDEDKDFFCPNCKPEKAEQFDGIRERLFQKVEELSSRQKEFGGVTICREMFKEKKNANSYNYSLEFPPTLRDLGARVKNKDMHITIGDFKYDYKIMCKRLTDELKEDYESRVQMIEWELDDITEDIFKNPPEEEMEQDEDNDAMLEYDLDKVKGERSDEENGLGAACEHCAKKFRNNSIYSCKRNHKVCDSCRKMHPGCVCPVCYDQHGDRKRLFLDNTTSFLWRVANMNSEEAEQLQLAGVNPVQMPCPKSRKRRSHEGQGVSRETASPSPQIMSVWSCTENNSTVINVPGPVVKEEPDFHHESISLVGDHQVESAEAEHQEEPVPTLDMSTVLADGMMSNQLLQLIDSNILATSNDSATVCSSQMQQVEEVEQQPTNYNDTGGSFVVGECYSQSPGDGYSQAPSFALTDAEINQHIQSIQAPLEVTSLDRSLLSLREELNKLLVLQSRGAEVADQIQRRREEIEKLKNVEQTATPEVLDPWQALEQLQEVSQTAVNLNQQLGNTSWAQFRARAKSQTTPSATPSVIQQPVQYRVQTVTSSQALEHSGHTVISGQALGHSGQALGHGVQAVPGGHAMELPGPSLEHSGHAVTNEQTLEQCIQSVTGDHFVQAQAHPLSNVQQHQVGVGSRVIIQYNQMSQADSSVTHQPIPSQRMQSNVIENRQKKVLEARGCRCEQLDSMMQEHSFNGPLSFSLLKNYSGSQLEWRPFLALFAATGPEMYQFQLGRAGHVFYIRAVTNHIENCRDRWTIQLINTSDLVSGDMVSKGGLFTYTGGGTSDSPPPHVLPTSIGPGDIRHYVVTVTQ